MPSERITCMRRGRLYMYSKRHRLNAGSTARVTYTRKAINGRSIRAAVRVRQKFTNLLVICRRRAQDSAHGSSASTCRSRRCQTVAIEDGWNCKIYWQGENVCARVDGFEKKCRTQHTTAITILDCRFGLSFTKKLLAPPELKETTTVRTYRGYE